MNRWANCWLIIKLLSEELIFLINTILFGIPPLKAQNDYVLKILGNHGPPGCACAARTAWVRLNHLTDVRRFRSCMCKWDMTASAACKCGAEDQTAKHVLQCPIYQPLGLHGLTVLDDETIDLLLNTCPEIECSLAVPERIGSNDEAASASLFLHTADIPI